MKNNGVLKTVLMTLAVLLAIAFLFTTVDDMLIYKARKDIEAGSVANGLEYYSRLINLFPDSPLLDDALYEAGAALWKKPNIEKGHIAVITSERAVVAGDGEDSRYAEMAGRLWMKLIRKYPHTPLARKARVGMAEIYFAEGDWDGIIDVLAGELNGYGDLRYYAAGLIARAYLEKGQPYKGLEVFKQFDGPLPAYLEMVRGDLLVAAGDYSAARAVYAGVTISGEDEHLEKYLLERKERLSNLIQGHSVQDALIYGRVTFNGKGLAGIKVTAVNKYIENKAVYTFTDLEGKYSFADVPEGVYYLAAEVPDKYITGKCFTVNGPSLVLVDGQGGHRVDLGLKDRIELKLYREGQTVQLSWEKVSGAEKYRIYIGEVVRRKGEDKPLIPVYLQVGENIVVSQKEGAAGDYTAYYTLAGEVRDSSFTLDCSKDYGKYHSPYIGKTSALPGFILGMPYYGGEFAFKIEAVDSEGKTVTSSNERLTMFPYHNTDKVRSLISNYRFEGAKDLLADWNTAEEGLLLARLYEATYKFSDSAEVYYKLHERVGDFNYLVKAASMWEKAGNYKKAVEVLESLPGRLKEAHYGDLGKLYFWLGEHNKAEMYFNASQAKEMQILYYLIKGDYQRVHEIVYSSPVTPFEFVVVKGIEQLRECSKEVSDLFEDSLNLLNNPSQQNRDKFMVCYRQFCKASGPQYPYLKTLLHELGSLYWDL